MGLFNSSKKGKPGETRKPRETRKSRYHAQIEKLLAAESLPITYSLRTDKDTYLDMLINEELFDEILTRIEDESLQLLILEPNKLISNSFLLQATRSKKEYLVEICIYDPEVDEPMAYDYFTNDRNELFKFFVDYWKTQQIPDYSDWMLL